MSDRHTKTNAICSESAFAEKLKMSFKPGEMADEGQQDRSNGEKGQPDQIRKCASDSKDKKMAKWEIGCGPGWARCFPCRKLRLFGQDAGVLAFLIADRRLSQKSGRYPIHYEYSVLMENNCPAFHAQIIPFSRGRRFSGREAPRLSFAQASNKQDAPETVLCCYIRFFPRFPTKEGPHFQWLCSYSK